jgi:autotransporter-associated beta strand protein
MGGVMYGTGTPEYYSNFIEPMGHQALGQKIMLFMIDALYGAPGPNSDPVKWTMAPFNNAWPCSVFLSQDAVAIDSVGFDFLNTEFGLPADTDYYLHEAAFVPGANGQKLSGIVYQPNVGSTQFVGSLGVEEHWNNTTSKQYTRNLGTGDGIELVSVQTGVYSLNIISPAGASSFAAGANLPITALVYANTNPVSQVAFYQGTTLLGVSTNSPYSFTWSNAPSGSYALTAVVTDSMGLKATSAIVYITVSCGPLTWNADPAMTGPQDGGGVWNLTSSNWWNGQTNVLWNNNQMPISTVLGAANGSAGTIALGAPITVNNLAFNPAGSGNYTIAGGGYALTLTNTPTITVASNCSPTISAPVTGAGFSLTGSGALTLSGTNTMSGAITINGGTLVLAGNNAGSTANCTVTPGTTLQLANANAFTGALALNSGSTLQLRADINTTFPPGSITLDNASDIYNFDVEPLTAATGQTLSLAGALTFLDSANQTINVTGNGGCTLALGTIVGTTTGHNPYLALAINTLANGASLTLASFQSGNWSQWLNLQGGGKVTITGNLTNLSDGSSVLYVTGGTTATLQGRSALWASASATADGYKYCVADGALVLDNGNALTNNSSGAGLTLSAFLLGAVTNVFTGSGFSAPAGVLVNSNNYFSAAVWLGDANFPSGGITNNARNTNYVADGDAGFANLGTFTIGGQNTSGTNAYANPIILGWTANKGKSVTLLATTGGEVDFTGGILQNGTDTTAGVQVGDSMHGGLIKFTGANTYAGGTTVANGTLLVNGSLASGAVAVQSGGALGGTGTINGPVTVQSAGTLSPGAPVGTLTINNSLTLAGNLLIAINKSLSPSNGLVAVSGVLTNAGAGVLTITNLGPALAAGDSFKLFSKPLPNGGALTIAPLVPAMGFGWVNNLAVNGTLGVVTVATNPANLTARCCNGELTLSWPSDHTGWRLEAQTNGLGTNWVVVSGSALTNLCNIPVIGTNRSVFFRLIYP